MQRLFIASCTLVVLGVVNGCAASSPPVAPTECVVVVSPASSSASTAEPQAFNVYDREASPAKEPVCVDLREALPRQPNQAQAYDDLAACEAEQGRIKDALSDAQKALALGIQDRDAKVMKSSRARVQNLLGRLSKITFRVEPDSLDQLRVVFDTVTVPTKSLAMKFSVDPGDHIVRASGARASKAVSFEERLDLKEGEQREITIRLQ